MKEEENKTSTIRARKTTVKKLEELKLVESESMDSVISRLIKYAPSVKVVIQHNSVNNNENANSLKAVEKQEEGGEK